ncbi:hypothetical protein FB451DRAFT_1398679 [Mycena latifolia]|nr:hypothetical protein FB451DRAFT_1398679 [Mycena latifolia]
MLALQLGLRFCEVSHASLFSPYVSHARSEHSRAAPSCIFRRPVSEVTCTQFQHDISRSAERSRVEINTAPRSSFKMILLFEQPPRRRPELRVYFSVPRERGYTFNIVHKCQYFSGVPASRVAARSTSVVNTSHVSSFTPHPSKGRTRHLHASTACSAAPKIFDSIFGCPPSKRTPVYGESRRNSAASHAHSTTRYIFAPSAMSSTDFLERTAPPRWSGGTWRRGNSQSTTDRADHRLRVAVGRDSRGGAMRACVRIKDRERAVDTSRSTDQNSNSTTPHAARAGAPRESAGWCACVARGVGAGVPAKPLRLVATQTQRAVRRRNRRRVRARLSRAPHARLGGLRGSGIARRGRFAHGQS